MKKILYLLLLTSQVFFAQSNFDAGNTFYKKGNYQEAISFYEQVLLTKKHSADLYFNLGNCYYKLNQVAPAVYNYEKALLLSPMDAEIQNNLKFAQKLQIDDINSAQTVGFNKVIEDFTSSLHYNTWAWFAVFLAFVFLLSFLGYYFSQRTAYKRFYFIGMFLVPLLILVTVSAALSEKNRIANDKPAIVFAEIAPVKAEPKQDLPDAFLLHEGSKVFIKENLDQWVKIQLIDGTEGWMLKSNVKELK
jgi:tetratricopeptide (TPR) repeat protein